MGWTGGDDIFDKVVPVVLGHVRDLDAATTIVDALFEVLLDHGWDTEEESLGALPEHEVIARVASRRSVLLESQWEQDGSGITAQSTKGFVRCDGCGRYQRYYRDEVDGDWGEPYSMPHGLATGEDACPYMGLGPHGEGVPPQ